MCIFQAATRCFQCMGATSEWNIKAPNGACQHFTRHRACLHESYSFARSSPFSGLFAFSNSHRRCRFRQNILSAGRRRMDLRGFLQRPLSGLRLPLRLPASDIGGARRYIYSVIGGMAQHTYRYIYIGKASGRSAQIALFLQNKGCRPSQILGEDAALLCRCPSKVVLRGGIALSCPLRYENLPAPV